MAIATDTPVAATPRSVDVRRLGLVAYGAGLELQAGLVEERRSGAIGDTLLLLEHPPVITLGVKTRGKHQLVRRLISRTRRKLGRLVGQA